MLNLQQAFDRFNKSLFGNRLPQVPVAFGPLSADKAGVFTGQYQQQSKTIVDGSARITISNRYQNANEPSILGILLHEMVHAYFYFARQFYVDHGQPFKRMLADLAQKAGIPAPMTEDLTNIDESITPIKVGVILMNKQGTDSYVYALVDPKTLDRETMKPSAKTLLRHYCDTYEAFEIETAKWSRIAMFVPLQRAGFDQLSYFKETDGVEGWVDDLRENGRIKLSMRRKRRD